LSDIGIIQGLSSLPKNNPAYQYRNYVQLPALGDGNCFLNAFSILLTGINYDSSLSLPLRVKICLELLTRFDIFSGTPEQKLTELKEKISGEYGFAKPGKWLENQDIVYMSYVLKRPIILVTVIPRDSGENDFGVLNSYNYFEDKSIFYFKNP
jgi:hypothetical protein